MKLKLSEIITWFYGANIPKSRNNEIQNTIVAYLKTENIEMYANSEHIKATGFKIDGECVGWSENYDDLIELIRNYPDWWKAKEYQLVFLPVKKIEYLQFELGVAKKDEAIEPADKTNQEVS